MVRVLIAAALAVSVVFSAAGAEPVPVANYSWLQASPGSIVAFIGSENAAAISAEGAPDNFRTAGYVWIPSTAMTAPGGVQQSYWAGLDLGQQRWIDSVNVQLWAHTNQAMVTKFVIEACNDGSSWVQVGAYDFGGSVNYQTTTTVYLKDSQGQSTASLYQYIRVRFEADGYEGGFSGAANYGGPGLVLLDPRASSAMLTGTQTVNWANAQFGAKVTGHGVSDGWDTLNDQPASSLNNGNLYYTMDHRGNRWGVESSDWGSKEAWIDIELDTARKIGEVVALWDSKYAGTGFTLQYSYDGNTYANVVMTGDIYRSGCDLYDYYSARMGADSSLTSFTFESVTAKYWRITEIQGEVFDNAQWKWAIFTEIMLLGPAVPEPATMTLLALGGLAMLRRRK